MQLLPFICDHNAVEKCALEEIFDDNYQSEYGTYYKVGMQYTHDYVLAAQYDTTKAVTIGKEKNPDLALGWVIAVMPGKDIYHRALLQLSSSKGFVCSLLRDAGKRNLDSLWVNLLLIHWLIKK